MAGGPARVLTPALLLLFLRAAEARRLLPGDGAAHPAVRHALRPAPALRGADGPGVRARLRGAGHAGREGPRHRGR